MDQEILSIEDISRTLQQDVDVIRGLLENGELPGRKIGNAWYVTRRQLVAFIEGQAAGSRGAPFDPEVGRADNSWTCMSCRSHNDAERARCSRCGMGRLTPLINYRRK